MRTGGLNKGTWTTISGNSGARKTVCEKQKFCSEPVTTSRILHPRLKIFFNRTGYRQDVTMNHIMAALRNTPYATTSSDLLDASRQPGVEQANARSLLMDVAVSNMMVQKKQKAAGLRSAKGRRRTPEEAKAALEVREIQLRLQ